jgi:hypothetical protein
MLVQEGIFVEAGGEEAPQLGRVPMHGRVRVQGETEDFKDHAAIRISSSRQKSSEFTHVLSLVELPAFLS